MEARGHVLRVRGACRGPRAKPAGRGLSACALPPPRPHPVPGVSATRGQERAALGFSAGRRGKPGRQVPRGPCWTALPARVSPCSFLLGAALAARGEKSYRDLRFSRGAARPTLRGQARG